MFGAVMIQLTSALIQLLPWALYLLFGYRFLAYVSKHAIALYCTRAESVDGSNVVKVFLQNVEEEALEGPYLLRIALPESPSPIDDRFVRAGPKSIFEYRSERGVWEVVFDRLPALDTWLFELRPPNDCGKVEVSLHRVAIARRLEDGSLAPVSTDDEPPLRVLSLPSLATSSLALKHGEPWAVEGSFTTPRASTVIWVAALAIIGYMLLIVRLLPFDCSSAKDALTLLECVSSGTWKHASLWDVGAVALLLAATLMSRFAGRRLPLPIAQGYLETTTIAPLAGAPRDESGGR